MIPPPWILMSSLSAFNLECGRIAMVFRSSSNGILLKGYHDGSGKKEHPDARFVTLAGYSATNETWTHFEKHWQRCLDKFDIPYFHMVEAIAGEPPFPREKGWDSNKAISAAIQLMGPLTNIPASDLFAFACTVEIEGYNKARALLGENLAPLEAICVDWCFGGLLQRLVKNADGTYAPIEAYFDKNETFLHWIDRIWRSKNAAQRFGCPALVATIAPVEMRQIRPIQAADIAAWAVRDFYESGAEQSSPLHVAVTLSSRLINRCYRFDDIMKHYTERPWR